MHTLCVKKYGNEKELAINTYYYGKFVRIVRNSNPQRKEKSVTDTIELLALDYQELHSLFGRNKYDACLPEHIESINHLRVF